MTEKEKKATTWQKAQILRAKLELCSYSTPKLFQARKAIRKRLTLWGPKTDCNDYRYVLHLTEYAINLEIKARNLTAMEPVRNSDDSIDRNATSVFKISCGLPVSRSHYRVKKKK